MNMNLPASRTPNFIRQTGLSLVEMMVSIAISLVVLSGVVNVLVVSKSNFISLREMSALQENARFALKYMTDEIRMSGASGCSAPVQVGNAINGGSAAWYMSGVGLKGYEYDAGINTFPADFRASVRTNTDALAISRGSSTGLQVTGHNANSAVISLATNTSYPQGTIFVMGSANCDAVGIFQMTGPNNGNANNIVHNTGGSIAPGNCSKGIGVAPTFASADCTTEANLANVSFGAGATLSLLQSEAYFVGNSESDSTVPALLRQRMALNTGTSTPYTLSEELVQGVENMQILYGVDRIVSSTGAVGNDGLADVYVKASGITGIAPWIWSNVVSVRLTLRMRSINPVYANNETYPVFEGITGTDGTDRYMRQTVSSTVMIRNYKK